MPLTVAVKAAHGDRMFIVFGPQVVAEESGPRILTPDAMDVTGLQRDSGNLRRGEVL